MTYKYYISHGLQSDGIKRINDDGTISYVPNDINNRDLIAYQEWLALGNTPEAAE